MKTILEIILITSLTLFILSFSYRGFYRRKFRQEKEGNKDPYWWFATKEIFTIKPLLYELVPFLIKIEENALSNKAIRFARIHNILSVIAIATLPIFVFSAIIGFLMYD